MGLPPICEIMDDLSRDFAHFLFGLHPEWQAYATAQRREGDTHDHLVVTVPSPAEGNALPLVMTTEDGEVRVHFDATHAHFEWPSGKEGFAWQDPMRFVDEIMKEEFAVASGWDGDRWCATWRIEPGENADSDVPLHATRLRVRSWTGARNEDFDLAG